MKSRVSKRIQKIEDSKFNLICWRVTITSGNGRESVNEFDNEDDAYTFFDRIKIRATDNWSNIDLDSLFDSGTFIS